MLEVDEGRAAWGDGVVGRWCREGKGSLEGMLAAVARMMSWVSFMSWGQVFFFFFAPEGFGGEDCIVVGVAGFLPRTVTSCSACTNMITAGT